MRPELFRLLDTGFPSYFVLLLSGFLFATALAVLWARRAGEDADVMVDLGLGMLIAGVIGSRLLHVLADGYFWDYVHLCTDPKAVVWPLEKAECVSDVYKGEWDPVAGVCHPGAADCFAWAKFWAGGLTYYGGFLGAGFAAVFLLRRDRFPFWRAADMAGFTIPLGLAFGRMGCLLGGCCFGAETRLPWAISFPPRSPASEAQFKAHALSTARAWSNPVHPTQIYESVMSLAIAAACLWIIHPRKRYDGHVFVWFVGLYAAGRFLVEILRRDDRGSAAGLSTSQLIGLGLLAGALVVHNMRKRKIAEEAAT